MMVKNLRFIMLLAILTGCTITIAPALTTTDSQETTIPKEQTSTTEETNSNTDSQTTGEEDFNILVVNNLMTTNKVGSNEPNWHEFISIIKADDETKILLFHKITHFLISE